MQRGCFFGTLAEFVSAVKERLTGTKDTETVAVMQEYLQLVKCWRAMYKQNLKRYEELFKEGLDDCSIDSLDAICAVFAERNQKQQVKVSTRTRKEKPTIRVLIPYTTTPQQEPLE